MKEATFSVNLIRDIVHYAAAQGIEVDSLCHAIGIDPQLLETPDSHITGEPLRSLWRELVQRTGDHDVGLHIGEHFNLAAIGLLGYVLFNCPTFEQVLEKLSRYLSLFSQGINLQVSVVNQQVWCDCTVVNHLKNYLIEEPRHPIESTFSALLTAAKTLTGQPLSPEVVWFQHPRPTTISEHQRIFQSPILFAQSTNRLVFNISCLKWSILSANASLLFVFEQHAEVMMRELSQTDTYSSQVVRSLIQGLKGEVPTIEAIARELTMSVRNLQRGLQAEGTSYQRLLEETRKELAIQYLKKPDVVIHDVAFLLGFSEPSAFHRAFKRWTGETPRKYRIKRRSQSTV
ncbi:MAG: AraC family transcriptional regulator [Oculatellaceae cyanobacterium bins.114]|nr:AraC family transcriptional regulator [Oculatellaceae cyanobacterium bins.114]